MIGDSVAEQIRIDKLLWYLRLVRSRTVAQAMVEAGHIRLEGRRISRSSAMVHAGQHLVIPLESDVIVIRLLQVPKRRGPAPEAQSCYERLNFEQKAANNGHSSINLAENPVPPI